MTIYQVRMATTSCPADLEATDLMLDAPRKTTLPRRAADEFRTPGESLHLQPVRAGDVGRADLEAYVRTRFAAKHDAAVRTFMPTLAAWVTPRASTLR